MKQLESFNENFESGWKHWLLLAEIKTGVNFNQFKNGIKSDVKYHILDMLDELVMEARKVEYGTQELEKQYEDRGYNQAIQSQNKNISNLKKLL